MPLQTFENLAEDRKQKILKVAFEEFALNNYKSASVSNIVKKLGLAKGSFYRYFKHKTDLYSYLVENAYQLRLKQLDVLLENREYDFFEILRENFRNKVIFDIQHPLESIFLFNLFQESDSPEVSHLYLKLKHEAIELTKNLIIHFQQKGDLNQNVDPKIAALFIFQTQLGIYDYLQFFKGINFKENIRKGNHVFALSEEEIMKIVEGILVLIKSGLKN